MVASAENVASLISARCNFCIFNGWKEEQIDDKQTNHGWQEEKIDQIYFQTGKLKNFEATDTLIPNHFN